MPDFKKLPTVNSTAVALVDHVHQAGGPASGPAFWLDASRIPGQVDGGAVAAWPDASGNGYDLTASGANRPTYKTGIANGRPVVRFDGTTDYLITASIVGSNLFGAAAATIFLVQRQDGAQATNTPLRWNHADATNKVNLYLSFSDVLYFDYGDEGAGGRISGAQPAGWDDAFHVTQLYRSGTTGRIDVDGVNVVSASFSDNLDPTPSATMTIGAASGTPDAPFKGDIAELLIYNRALSTAEGRRVEAYLTDKYGLIAPLVFPPGFASTVKWGTD